MEVCGNLRPFPSTSTSASYSYVFTVTIFMELTCRAQWAPWVQYLVSRMPYFSSSPYSCLLPAPLSTPPDHEATVGGCRVKLLTSTLTTTTKEPTPPAALTPLLPPSPTLSPSADLASTVTFSMMVPIRLVSPSSSSDSDYCSRHLSFSCSCCLYHVNGVRLALMAAFAVTVLDASDQVRTVTSRPKLSRFKIIYRLNLIYTYLG